jgi:methylmalonyl-CoA mutase N-terminal domain/subunit
MTYQQPLNNIVRGTLMGLAGVLGGTQSLGVSGYDEAVSIPSEHAHQMSLRIQQIIQNETGLIDVVDPLGGSYLIEALTMQIKDAAWEVFEHIEAQGGFLASLDSGWLHSIADDNQNALSQDVEAGTRKIVGVNFADADVSPFSVTGFEGTSDAWERGMERIAELRRTRSSALHGRAIKELRSACIGDTNIIPPMIDAVAADATLGEIGEVFRDVFGDWDVPIRF